MLTADVRSNRSAPSEGLHPLDRLVCCTALAGGQLFVHGAYLLFWCANVQNPEPWARLGSSRTVLLLPAEHCTSGCTALCSTFACCHAMHF